MNEQKTKPKKSLGQNFLKDPKILKKIVDFAKIEGSDLMVEIGPGQGDLTKLLLEKTKKVIAIEKDEALVKILKEKFDEEILNGRLEIVNADILNCELKIENYVLVGNIPYYITGLIFRKFLAETKNKPKSITFVVQKEVAERIMAKDNKESILSVSVKAYGEPEFGGIIKAGSFSPRPKVDSAIISIRNISEDGFKITPPTPLTLREAGEEKYLKGRPKNLEVKFFEILKAGFAHKRKLLLKNLSGSIRSVSRVPLDTSRAKEAFEKCGIAEKARAENLKVSDWLCLTKELI